MEKLVKTSYRKKDVTILLEDYTDRITELRVDEYIEHLEHGGSMHNVLMYEKLPTHEMNLLYYTMMDKYARSTAALVATVCKKLWAIHGPNLTLVSIGNSATPVGVLIKRYYEFKYKVEISHYNISIIRGVGLDTVALEYIRKRHPDSSIRFVDGWTGKGLISDELASYMQEYPNIDSELAVLVDLAGHTKICGTHKDYIIPSACMNSIISGLVSRSFIDDQKPENSMHGAIYYYRYEDSDYTYRLINGIVRYYTQLEESELFGESEIISDDDLLKDLMIKYNKKSLNKIRPGICETVRALLKGTTEVLLVNSFVDRDVEYLIKIGKEHGIPVIKADLLNYKCCAITK